MKKLLKRLIVLFSIIILTNVIIIKYFLPFGWGDPILIPKIEHFEQNANQYNALFFGESMTYRQINPKTIDYQVSKNGFEFRSFNFGADAHNMLQQMREADYILAQNPQIKYAFFNLAMTADLFWSNLHTAYIMHWLDFNSVEKGIKISLESTYLGKMKKRQYAAKNYALSYIEKSLLFGVMPSAIANLSQDNSHYLGYDSTGFYPYSDTASQMLTINKESETLLREMRAQYLENDTLRAKIRKTTLEAYNETSETYKMPTFTQLIKDYIAEKAKQNIHVFVILPPKMDKYYEMLLPVFKALPEKNRIGLADPTQYAAFYSLENTFNFRHLNEVGAELYSQVLSQKIVSLLSEKGKKNTIYNKSISE